MKDAQFYLLTEIFRLLNGAISVSVFNMEQPIENTVTEYVKTASVSVIPSKTKDSFMGEYLVNLDVVTLVPMNAASEFRLNQIVNEVLPIMCPTPTTHGFNNSSDFAVGRVTNEGSVSFSDTFNTQKRLRRVLEFRILVKQR